MPSRSRDEQIAQIKAETGCSTAPCRQEGGPRCWCHAVFNAAQTLVPRREWELRAALLAEGLK